MGQKYTYLKDNISYEKCVMCGKELDIPTDRNINLRSHYIEGMGQVCSECYNSVYKD